MHKALEVGTPYKKWFKRMMAYGFSENIDYILVVQKCPTNNPRNSYTEITDHILKLDMTKELCMIQRSPIGKKFRQYFIEVKNN